MIIAIIVSIAIIVDILIIIVSIAYLRPHYIYWSGRPSVSSCPFFLTKQLLSYPVPNPEYTKTGGPDSTCIGHVPIYTPRYTLPRGGFYHTLLRRISIS